MSDATASILIPTRDRPDYLEVALSSIVPQALTAGAEVVVIDDGTDDATGTVARRHGVRVLRVPPPGGLNVARNAGIAATSAPLVVLVDDDVRVPDGWLAAILQGAAGAPEYEAFGGPIEAELEGGGPRSCGREKPPITTLDLGHADTDAELVWGANMAVRRSALERVGSFDESLSGPGDEEQWERRLRQQGGRIRYLAAAGLVHRRSARDATLRRLTRAGWNRGRAARRFDVRKQTAPAAVRELRTLAGCIWHIGRRRCAGGIVLSAVAAGRVWETVAPAPAPAPAPGPAGPATRDAALDDWQSGTSGQVHGVRATTRALVGDGFCDAIALARLQRWRLRRAAAALPRRRVLVLALERRDAPNVLAAARAELERSRHDVTMVVRDVGSAGKFENLDAMLAEHPADGYDWLLLLDDDVALPHGFLDSFLFLAEHFGFALAQPAHRRRSHAAWPVTRRRPGVVARQTAFVEIGPVSALAAATFDALLPFPPLRFGWGLDAHWAAIACEHDWRVGIIDATPVQHGLRRIASGYSRDAAVAEARMFLADHRYLPAAQLRGTVAVHGSWR